jgi:hypothetical protein
MMFRNFPAAAVAPIIFLVISLSAAAEMGRCVPDGEGYMLCGSGAGAARVIAKTISPSKRLAFAWRLTDRPPTTRPDADDRGLENMIVRLDNGAVLAKSHGTYWDLGQKIAKQYMFAVWSPDSRLLVKVAQSAEFTSAEFFSFASDDTATGPFELVDAIVPALQAKIGGKGTGTNDFVFSSHPVMTLNNQGLLQGVVDVKNVGVYDLELQVTHVADFFDAKVVSISEHAGVSISVTVH